MMIPDLNSDGWLPRGRFCADLDEVKARFVDASGYSGSSTRQSVWSDFIDVVDLIKAARVKVPAAFLGGSFVTDEHEPGDIDAAFIIDVSRISNPLTLTNVSSSVRGAKSIGLQVDGFLIQWFPDGTETGGEPSYLRERGRWDDFWQRHVPKLDRNPPQRHHSMPRRGYLEVIIDGYR